MKQSKKDYRSHTTPQLNLYREIKIQNQNNSKRQMREAIRRTTVGVGHKTGQQTQLKKTIENS
jgi:hypothetical protein